MLSNNNGDSSTVFSLVLHVLEALQPLFTPASKGQLLPLAFATDGPGCLLFLRLLPLLGHLFLNLTTGCPRWPTAMSFLEAYACLQPSAATHFHASHQAQHRGWPGSGPNSS